MADGACPDCGGELRFEEKDTSSGRDMREYRCVKCGRSVVEHRGKALWQILHEDREGQERRRAQPAKIPWWKPWKRRA